MLGGELLMPLAECKALRRLDETLGALGILLNIHSLSSTRQACPEATGPAVILINFARQRLPPSLGAKLR